jgi:hypothetical protein
MAKQKEVIFVVPYKVIDKQGNIVDEDIMDMKAVSIEQAESRVAYIKVRFTKNHVPDHPGCSITFGDTKTKDGRYIHAPQKNWQKLQEAVEKLGIKMSDTDARWFQKNWHITARNMKSMAKEIAKIYNGGNQE